MFHSHHTPRRRRNFYSHTSTPESTPNRLASRPTRASGSCSGAQRSALAREPDVTARFRHKAPGQIHAPLPRCPDAGTITPVGLVRRRIISAANLRRRQPTQVRSGATALPHRSRVTPPRRSPPRTLLARTLLAQKRRRPHQLPLTPSPQQQPWRRRRQLLRSRRPSSSRLRSARRHPLPASRPGSQGRRPPIRPQPTPVPRGRPPPLRAESRT